MNQRTPPALASRVPAHHPGEVSRVWWKSYRVPFRRQFVAAHGAQSFREGLLVGIETDAGGFGLGEASPLPGYSGGSLRETAAAIATLARPLLGSTPECAWTTGVALPGVSVGSANAARCGVETAAADLLARVRGISLAALIAGPAGMSSNTPARIPVNATIDLSEPVDAADEARTLVRAGFGTLKLKVGTHHATDLARVLAVREAVGHSIELRIDANGSWTAGESPNLLDQYGSLGVALCEQPISRQTPDALKLLAALRSQSPIPIALDESCRTQGDLAAIIAAGAADAVVLKPMASGLRTALAMLRSATEHRLPVIVTTMFDAGPGVAVASHLAALCSPLPRIRERSGVTAHGLATVNHLESSLVIGATRIEHGSVCVPELPGLGLELDSTALARYEGTISVELRVE